MRDKANIIRHSLPLSIYSAVGFASENDERIKTHLALRKYFAIDFPGTDSLKIAEISLARSLARPFRSRHQAASKVCSAIISLLRNLGNRRRNRYPAYERCETINRIIALTERRRHRTRSARLIINRGGAIMPRRMHTCVFRARTHTHTPMCAYIRTCVPGFCLIPRVMLFSRVVGMSLRPSLFSSFSFSFPSLSLFLSLPLPVFPCVSLFAYSRM